MGEKLRPRDACVLGLIEHRAGEPLSVFAEKLNLKEGTLRYYVQSLIEKRIITGCMPFVNLCVLGYTNYTVFFSLAAATRQQRNELFASLCETERTCWVGRFSGPYEIGAVILARGAEDLNSIYQEVTERFGSYINQKNISIKTDFINFGHKILGSESPVIELGYHSTRKRVEVDEIDLRILSVMLSSKTIALRQVERLTSIPFSTVRRRVARLEELGVILGYQYQYDLRSFGVREYSLLLSSSVGRQSLAAELFEYSRKDKNIRAYIRTFGPWDFELLISVSPGQEVQSVVDRIFERFGSDFRQSALLEIFEEGKVFAATGAKESNFQVTLAA